MYRKANTNDCRKVYELICDMENKMLPYEAFSGIFLAQLNDSHYYCLVYEQDDHVAGVLNLRFEGQLHHAARIAEIMELSVDPACRNRGIGRKMLEEACRIAEQHGCGQIEVACNRLRTDTHRFYLREGMHNYHFKFSRSLPEDHSPGNAIGR